MILSECEALADAHLHRTIPGRSRPRFPADYGGKVRALARLLVPVGYASEQAFNVITIGTPNAASAAPPNAGSAELGSQERGMHFFIVGTGRCGTRLLRRIFNQHPLVFVPHETHWIPTMHTFFGMAPQPLAAFTDIVDRTEHVTGVPTIDIILREVGTTRLPFYRKLENELGSRGQIDMAAVNEAMFRLVAAQRSKSIVGDKTPDYGFYMTLLQQLWPGTKFIHLVRDGRDVALSMSKHPGFQRMVQLKVNNWCPVSFNRYYRVGHLRRRLRAASARVLRPLGRGRGGMLPDYIRLWESRITRIADEASRVRPGSVLEIRYEDLVAEPGDAVVRLAGFLDLPVPPDWQAAARDTIRPGNVGKVADPELHRELTALCETTLARYGYVARQERG